MNLLIRIPLPVQQMTALAGYFTDGPNMMALYGLVSQLEEEAEFEATGFGLVMESYASKVYTGEYVTTGLDAMAKGKQADGSRSMLGFRYADMTAALYLEVDAQDWDEHDRADLVQAVAHAVNRARMQGGNVVEHISADPKDRWGVKSQLVSDSEDLYAFIAQHEKAISKVYLSCHQPQALAGDALLDAYARALTEKDKLLVCNGYRQVGQVQDALGNSQRIGDSVYTLAQAVPVYQLKDKRPSEREALLNRFFWSFDTAENARNPLHFILN